MAGILFLTQKKGGHMCGIAGYINWRGGIKKPNVIRRMTKTLAKRGPDSQGVWIDEHAALGHTRLSIIDISGGAQPMVTKSKKQTTLVITFNGELFNYRELRSELINHGHKFTTQSDTEVILRAYDQWKENCVDHFTGMFAFAIWDEARRQLFLVRDPLGVKPLYFYKTPRGVVFGSEEKALFEHPNVSAQLDLTGMAELFCMTPMTNPSGAIFCGMEQVRPGTSVTFTANQMTKRCYWKLEAIPHTDNQKQTVARLRELFEASVQSQLVSDVPLGAMLSGGVDSSAVAAFSAKLQRASGKQLPTFAIDYESDDTSYSASSLHVDRDTPWAEKTAKFIGSNHSTHCVSAKNLLAAHQNVLTAWGRPSYSPVNMSLYLLFRHIRESGVRTVLGGEGANESLGGYRWWRDPEDVENDGFPWHRTYRSAAYLLNPGIIQEINPEKYLRESYHAALAEVPHLTGENRQERRMREISWLTFTYYLNFLLHRVDRMSMAAGVEARVPFCDHNFVQYAWNIPWEMKNLRSIEKGVFRKAIEDTLPKDVIWRRKSGYPVAQMSEYQKELWTEMRQLLDSPIEPIWQIVDKFVVERVINEQEGNISDWTWLNHISYVLEMNNWCRQIRIRLAF